MIRGTLTMNKTTVEEVSVVLRVPVVCCVGCGEDRLMAVLKDLVS